MRPVDNLACHRLAVFLPGGGTSGGGEEGEIIMGDGSGDLGGMPTASSTSLQVGTRPWQPHRQAVGTSTRVDASLLGHEYVRIRRILGCGARQASGLAPQLRPRMLPV